MTANLGNPPAAAEVASVCHVEIHPEQSRLPPITQKHPIEGLVTGASESAS